MEHLDYRLLIRYVSDAASSREQLVVEEHVADCAVCLQHIRGLRYLQHNFESVWAAWLPAELERLHRQCKLAAGLARIAESASKLADPAKRWLDTLNDGSTTALKAILNRTKGLAAIGLGRLPEGYSFQLQPAVPGVGAPDRQAQRHLQRGSELLATGQLDEAERELSQAGRADARFCQSARSDIAREDRQQAQVTVDSRRGRVAVRFWSFRGEANPQFALLLPSGNPEEAVAAEFEVVQGEKFLLAEFSNVPDGLVELYW